MLSQGGVDYLNHTSLKEDFRSPAVGLQISHLENHGLNESNYGDISVNAKTRASFLVAFWPHLNTTARDFVFGVVFHVIPTNNTTIVEGSSQL